MDPWNRAIGYLDRISLVPKMLVLTVLAGGVIWIIADSVQTAKLRVLFQTDLVEELERQSRDDRIRFDNRVESYHHAAKLLTNQKSFHDAVSALRRNRKGGRIVRHREVPRWLPDASVLRHIVHFQYALLLDGQGRVTEVYENDADEVPLTLLGPNELLIRLSHNQSFTTIVEGEPVVLAAESIANDRGLTAATLLLVARLNSDFLVEAHRPSEDKTIIALVGGEPGRIVATSRPDLIDKGELLSGLMERYLVTTKSFFDRGGSDLVLQYTALVSKAEIDRLSGVILRDERLQRGVIAALLIGAFGLIMLSVTRSVQKVTREVVALSKDELGIQPRDIPKGDQLKVLASLFERFAEEVVLAREAKYRRLYESMTDAFVRTDMAGKILECNRAYQEMVGYAEAELRQMTSVELTPEKWHDVEARIVNGQILPEGFSDVYEKEYIRKDGSVIPVELRTFLVRDKGGNPFGMWSIVRDITERKRAETELRHAKQFSDSLIRTANVIVVVLNQNGEVLMLNETGEQATGYRQQELAGRSWFETLAPRDRYPEAWEEFKRLTRKKAFESTFTNPIVTKDGVERIISWQNSTLATEQGLVTVAFGIDMTERRHAEERYRNILNTAIDGYWLTDARGRLLEANDAYCRMSGYRREELLHMSISDLDAVEDPEATRKHIELISRQGSDRFESQHRRRDGTIMDVEVSAQYLNEQGGMFIAFLKDITERKRAEDAIRTSLREKETLLKEVHHRVKNNLQIIASLLYFQAKKIAEPASLAVFDEARDRLRSMILVHEKLYRSRDLARVDFRDYLFSLLDQLRAAHAEESRSVRLDAEIDDLNLPIEVALPAGMIINELVTNIYKYAFPGGREGSAWVRIVRNNAALLVDVGDEGVGIPGSVNTELPTSFGLQLVDNLVKQLNGSMTIERGQGTRVRLLLPFTGYDHGGHA